MTYLYGVSSGSAGGSTNVRTVTASGAVSQTGTDNIIIVKKTVAAPTTVNLLSNPTVGQSITVKDGLGDANVNPITIVPASGTIDGQPNLVINTAFGAATLAYTGLGWTATTNESLVRNAESAPRTSVTTTGQNIFASPSYGHAFAAGSAYDTWALNASGQVVHNGVVDTTLGSTSQLYYLGHTVYAKTGGTWYYYNTGSLAPSVNLMPDSANQTVVLGTLGSGGAFANGLNAAQNGLTYIITGSGTDAETGLPYTDFRMFGTMNSSASTNIYSNLMPVVSGGTYSLSLQMQLLAGSNSSVVSVNPRYDCYTGTTTYGTTVSAFISATPSSTKGLISLTHVIPTGSYDHAQWNIGFPIPASTVVDATYRLLAPQFERATYPTTFAITPKYGAWVTAADPTVPPPAQGAGFSNLVFFDDFTTTDTIDQTGSSNFTGNLKWFWSYQTTSANEFVVSPNATAASISNGNVGGGENASPAGGVLTINQTEQWSGLISVPGNYLNNSSATLPTKGCWQHMYIEIYAQFSITPPPTFTGSPPEWPSLWMWSAEALGQYGFGNSSLKVIGSPGFAQIDILESMGWQNGNYPGYYTGTVHNQVWTGSPGNYTTTDDAFSSGWTTDSNWHTYGLLWTSTGTGTGQMQFYKDNQLIRTGFGDGSGNVVIASGNGTVPTGTGQRIIGVESQHLFLTLSSAVGWPMNIDWVKVWQ